MKKSLFNKILVTVASIVDKLHRKNYLRKNYTVPEGIEINNRVLAGR